MYTKPLPLDKTIPPSSPISPNKYINHSLQSNYTTPPTNKQYRSTKYTSSNNFAPSVAGRFLESRFESSSSTNAKRHQINLSASVSSPLQEISKLNHSDKPNQLVEQFEQETQPAQTQQAQDQCTQKEKEYDQNRQQDEQSTNQQHIQQNDSIGGPKDIPRTDQEQQLQREHIEDEPANEQEDQDDEHVLRSPKQNTTDEEHGQQKTAEPDDNSVNKNDQHKKNSDVQSPSSQNKRKQSPTTIQPSKPSKLTSSKSSFAITNTVHSYDISNQHHRQPFYNLFVDNVYIHNFLYSFGVCLFVFM
jgi:hypothetical protein